MYDYNCDSIRHLLENSLLRTDCISSLLGCWVGEGASLASSWGHILHRQEAVRSDSLRQNCQQSRYSEMVKEHKICHCVLLDICLSFYNALIVHSIIVKVVSCCCDKTFIFSGCWFRLRNLMITQMKLGGEQVAKNEGLKHFIFVKYNLCYSYTSNI